MRSRFHLPLRLKILGAVLLVVTAIVSVITFTMAKLFHEDKSAYVTASVSDAAESAAAEASAVLASYEARLRSAGRVLGDDGVRPDSKRGFLDEYFTEFSELIGLAIFADGREALKMVDTFKTAADEVPVSELEALLARAPELVQKSSAGETVVMNASVSRRLPCILMAFTVPSPSGGARTVIGALLRLDGMFPIATRSDRYEVSLSDAENVLLVARDPGRVARRERQGLVLPEAVQQDRQGAMTQRLDIGGAIVIVGVASTETGGVKATASLPEKAALLASWSLLSRLLLVSLALLVVAAVGAALWARRITGPVERLSTATGEVAKGQFDTQVPVESADEIGRLAESFNAMAAELKSRDQALHDAQGQLVQSEKMAAFGLLGAGIAHEVKNPLAGILGCAQISLRQAPAGSPVHANLVLIEKETKRCKMIIENLLKFARQERTTTEMMDVNRPLQDAVSIVHHQMELQKVKVETSLAENLPPIRGNANQLQQVFMNLMINAQQAMGPEGGSVVVSTAWRGDRRVEITIRDTGSGIPKEIQKRIFEPFYTTKPNGRGTGLGLSVSYGIVRDHGGEISVDSEPGQGATFRIVLPAVEAAPEVETQAREEVRA